jgi:hypothetical protein
MAPPNKKQINKGFYGFESDDAEFLRPDGAAGTDPFKADGHSTVGYNARFDDVAGTRDYEGYGDYRGERDEEAFLRPSTNRPHESDASIHEDLADLIDGQRDQPTGPITGGGGPVSDNVTRTGRDGQWSGSGRKGPRYKNPLGAQGQGNLRRR